MWVEVCSKVVARLWNRGINFQFCQKIRIRCIGMTGCEQGLLVNGLLFLMYCRELIGNVHVVSHVEIEASARMHSWTNVGDD